MKNLKMFAISLVAFAAMTMGVHATGTDCTAPGEDGYGTNGKTKCVATVGADRYDKFSNAWNDAVTDGGTITLLDNVSFNDGSNIKQDYTAKNVTIELGEFTLNMGAWHMGVRSGATLTINGSEDAVYTTSHSSEAFYVNDAESKLVITGALTLEDTTAGATLVRTDGNASITGGATIKVSNSSTIVTLSATKASATLDAKLGSVDKKGNITVGASTLVYAQVAATNKEIPSLTITGGEYYVSGVGINITNGLAATVKGGTITSTGKQAADLTKGSLEITDGALITDANGAAAIKTESGAEGSLTISGGTVTAKSWNAISMLAEDVVYAISGGTFNGGTKGGAKDGERYPALYINDGILTGLDKDPKADNFKGILTGGRYLVSIIGGRGVSSAATVQNYVVAEGATVTEDGNYKVINAKVEDPKDEPTVGDGDANDQKPAENVPNVPKTSDNILVYASLGLISAVSVGFTAKRKENN